MRTQNAYDRIHATEHERERGGPGVSVLMVTYEGDDPEELEGALRSLYDQTRPAEEVVLVRNGPLPAASTAVLERWHARLPIVDVAIEVNAPFPQALNAGLDACSKELVARMDADDVCLPKRFEVQVAHMLHQPETDVLGGAIEEFDTDPDTPERTRTMPLAHEAIRDTARWRNPMNHMTVMFRRSVVIEAGGYRDLPGFEDYDLWVRLLARGRRLENLANHLVAARIGNGFVSRRRGLSYARAEWRAMNEIAQHRLHGPALMRLSMPMRFVVRCLPAPVTGLAYRPLRKSPAEINRIGPSVLADGPAGTS